MILRVFVFTAIFTGLFQAGCTTTKKEPQFAGAALFPPLQTPSKETPIHLGRGSILWGDHDYVTGVDASWVGNIVNKEFNGGAGSIVFHSTNGKAHITPIQISGVTNINRGETKIEGLQFAGLVNYSDKQRVIGLQMAGLANVGMKNTVYGFQVGIYNEAEAIYGFQIGILNRTKNLYGLQIGLLNTSSNNGLPVSPILNFGF